MTDLHVTQNLIGIRDAIREQEDAADPRLDSIEPAWQLAALVV